MARPRRVKLDTLSCECKRVEPSEHRGRVEVDLDDCKCGADFSRRSRTEIPVTFKTGHIDSPGVD